MRIATEAIFTDMKDRIQVLASGLRTVQERLASQRKINRPSDDPVGAVGALGYRTLLNRLEQYGRNLNTAQTWMQTSETALSNTVDVVTRARELTVQMANAGQNAQTRASTAVEVGHLLDEAIALANAQVSGRHVFGGYRTEAAPFVKVNNGTIDTARYDGDGNDFQVAIGQNETLTAGRNGQTVFMAAGLFDTLGTLKRALENNDLAGIQQSLTGLEQAFDYLNNQTADIGARANRLEMRQGILDSLTVDFTEQLSRVEDADVAELSIELNQVQLAYQAVLLSTARIGDLSLTNYL
jgi:flagellar hook-associated protein 3 FlgL